MEGQRGRLALRAGRPADAGRKVILAETSADPDLVFVALADARRRELLELLARGPDTSAGALAAVLPVSRQAVAQHLAVLEEARLVTRRRAGRRVVFTVRPEGLMATATWLAARAAAWEGKKIR
ncbi:MAG: ArsR/SmtB family transcription factor [Trebonia sp.]